MTVRDVFNALAMHAPVELKMDFDNVGHLAGRADAAVTGLWWRWTSPTR